MSPSPRRSTLPTMSDQAAHRALRTMAALAFVATVPALLLACSGSESVSTGTGSSESDLSECAEGMTGSASSGTPDTYSFRVHEGDPFSADITGTSNNGGGTWGLVVSDGKSSGVFCDKTPSCSFTVPSGVTRILVTATTTDIGYYKLSVHCQHQPAPATPSAPTPSAPTTPWVCPGKSVTVGNETDLETLITGQESSGCFGFDALVGPPPASDPACSCNHDDDAVRFQLCSSSPCTHATELGSDTLERSGSWMRINTGYYNQSPRARLFLTGTSLRNGPVKVCYRNVHSC